MLVDWPFTFLILKSDLDAFGPTSIAFERLIVCRSVCGGRGEEVGRRCRLSCFSAARLLLVVFAKGPQRPSDALEGQSCPFCLAFGV